MIFVDSIFKLDLYGCEFFFFFSMTKLFLAHLCCFLVMCDDFFNLLKPVTVASSLCGNGSFHFKTYRTCNFQQTFSFSGTFKYCCYLRLSLFQMCFTVIFLFFFVVLKEQITSSLAVTAIYVRHGIFRYLHMYDITVCCNSI